MECPICRADISAKEATTIEDYHLGMILNVHCHLCNGDSLAFLDTDDFGVIK